MVGVGGGMVAVAVAVTVVAAMVAMAAVVMAKVKVVVAMVMVLVVVVTAVVVVAVAVFPLREMSEPKMPFCFHFHGHHHLEYAVNSYVRAHAMWDTAPFFLPRIPQPTHSIISINVFTAITRTRHTSHFVKLGTFGRNTTISLRNYLCLRVIFKVRINMQICGLAERGNCSSFLGLPCFWPPDWSRAF